MRTLKKISADAQEAIINVQRVILQNCSEEKEGYNFIEDNFPPTFRTTYLCNVTGNPAKPYSELAPHWKPSLSKLSNWILGKVDSGNMDLPLLADRSLEKNIFVPDRNGIIDVRLYISDQGINCKYKGYSIVNTLAPFIGKDVKLEDLEPFYVFRDSN